ncbi:MAG: maleylpyruvate isomerase N-terminal domain-containing protein [Dehalococcoidia bacterium]|nr:maleylpyruvate isomerase N-terminal domain-containing protein [Dehalococcoidia bacterium]
MSTNDEALNRVQVHQRESDTLQSLMETFTDDDWLRSSACDKWSVSDVIAHLANGHAGRVESIGRGIRGEPPTAPAGYSMPDGGPARDQVIAERAIAVQKEHRGDLVSYFKNNAQRLNETLAGITPDVLEAWQGNSHGARLHQPIHRRAGHAFVGHPVRFRFQRPHQPRSLARLPGRSPEVVGCDFQGRPQAGISPQVPVPPFRTCKPRR